MDILAGLTLAVNYLGLIGTVWLGLYLVTRSPRYALSWLTALTLWSLSGIFINILLSLNPLPEPAFRPSWLRFLFPFWTGIIEGEPNAWLQGWSVAPAIAFWHHATMLLRPGRLNPWRTLRIILVYLVAAAAIEVQAQTQILVSVKGGDPLYMNTLHAGPLYSIFGVALVGFTVMCLINLLRSARHAASEIQRKQLLTMAAVTVVGGLSGPLSITTSYLGLPVPVVVLSFIMAITVGLIGYGVASYSALVEGRTLDRDIRLSLVMAFLVAAAYFAVALLLGLAYKAPLALLVLLPPVAITTHMLAGSAHQIMDLFLLRHDGHGLRMELQHLTRLAGEGEPLQGTLNRAMDILCISIHAIYGLLLVFEGETVRLLADYHWNAGRVKFIPKELSADDVTHLSTGHFPAPLQEAALLIPLYDGDQQVGALVLGRPFNGTRYADQDIENLMNSVDWIGKTIGHSRRQTSYMAEVSRLVRAHPEEVSRQEATMPMDVVEGALRNLFDYTYLADSALASLTIVRQRLDERLVTHLERGKTVHEVLREALEKLRPAGDLPGEFPPREWYPYLILRDAYLENIPNRDIMLRLYISEGTFNRTRRSAIRSLSRALFEMEIAVA